MRDDRMEQLRKHFANDGPAMELISHIDWLNREIARLKAEAVRDLQRDANRVFSEGIHVYRPNPGDFE